MPNITLRIVGRVATADAAEIVNGNDDYTVTVEADNEWSRYASIKLVFVRYLMDGTTPETEIELDGFSASLPALSDTGAIGLGLTATNGSNTVRSTTATILCAGCITDGDTVEYSIAFDIYNSMMEYLHGEMSGAATEAELAEQYQAIENYWAGLPDNVVYPASYRAAIASPFRYTKLEGVLTDTSGNEMHLTSDNFVSDSVSIAFDCTSDGGILPGGVPSSELRMTLRGIENDTSLYGAEISMTFFIMLPDGWYPVPLGTFTLAGVEDDTQQGIAITAYDDMYTMDSISVSTLPIKKDAAYTPQEIITMCADALGVDYHDDVSDWVNGGRAFVLSDVASNVKTARDLLMHTVQIICAFAYIDRYRRLRVVPLAVHHTLVTVTENQRTSIAVTRQAYQLYRLITSVEYPNEDGGKEIRALEYYTMWSDGVTAELAENPLFTILDSEQLYRIGRIQQMLTNITNQLDLVTFHPISASIYGDPSVEPFEWRTFTLDGDSYNAPIMIQDWNYSGVTTISSSGQDAVAGIVQDQVQKAAFAQRVNASAQSDNVFRDAYLALIRMNGHTAMAFRRHNWLAHFTQGELSGEENGP